MVFIAPPQHRESARFLSRTLLTAAHCITAASQEIASMREQLLYWSRRRGRSENDGNTRNSTTELDIDSKCSLSTQKRTNLLQEQEELAIQSNLQPNQESHKLSIEIPNILFPSNQSTTTCMINAKKKSKKNCRKRTNLDSQEEYQPKSVHGDEHSSTKQKKKAENTKTSILLCRLLY
eukprot:TRINITY_DN3624_c0_g1_i2.p2 TRINITY_DN3624_c0_g1~~TRINITY_DN3624_c0_g1_i2.p2  ORF type:complete len:178 (-),score=43.75 TRINITY_DN3624_c0_g1_i2:50-583(-)